MEHRAMPNPTHSWNWSNDNCVWAPAIERRRSSACSMEHFIPTRSKQSCNRAPVPVTRH
jgi:hypothetical protein